MRWNLHIGGGVYFFVIHFRELKREMGKDDALSPPSISYFFQVVKIIDPEFMTPHGAAGRYCSLS